VQASQVGVKFSVFQLLALRQSASIVQRAP